MARGLTDNTFSEEKAKALHAWRLDRDQLLMLVRWTELLGDSIQTGKSLSHHLRHKWGFLHVAACIGQKHQAPGGLPTAATLPALRTAVSAMR